MYGDTTSKRRLRRMESKDDGETVQPSASQRPTLKSSQRSSLMQSVRGRFRSSSGSSSGNSSNRGSQENAKLLPGQQHQLTRRPSQPPNYDFLSNQEEEGEGSLLPTAKWWHGIFFFSFLSLIACAVTLWAPYPIGARMPTDMVAETPWSDGCADNLQSCICPRETICADDLTTMILLTIARCSAWFDYPLYMCLFLSKCNSINNYLQKTVLRCYINFSDYHKVHRLFGIIVGIESACHSLFHIARWARRDNDIVLLWTNPTGITGLIALVSGAFITLPMVLPTLKRVMSYEWRKGLHYLAILWAAGLMCHAPQRIFWMIGIPLFLYLTDKVIEIFSKTHLIESAHFERLSDNICTITFENPPGFGKQNSAYVYLMLPWISRYQFHAFTVFPGNTPNTSCICINKCGDWTEALMKEISTPTHKPAFVMGPNLSPFSSPAMDSENVVAVASGIGVTPAMSLIKQYSSTSRRMNLIWVCRDAALVEHFLQSLDVGADGHILIYYTGKRPLYLCDDLPPNVVLFKGRPDLEKTISGVILSTVNDESGLPNELYANNSVVEKVTPQLSAMLLLEKALSVYSIDQLFDYAMRTSASLLDEDEPPLKNAASFKGVLIMMKQLLGEDCDFMIEKILKNLDAADSYGGSVLTRDMFEDFMTLMREDNAKQDDTETKPQDGECLDVKRVPLADVKDSLSSGMFGVKKYLQSDGKFSSKNWKLLYCGGSEAVLGKLREYKSKYSIGLSVEKFDW
jgi:hypothetical protein